MLDKVLNRKNRVQPTSYDSMLFHSTRSAQLASSAVVCGILCFFVEQLLHDKQHISWTFILLRDIRFTIGHVYSLKHGPSLFA